jgi:hypothetical protein
MTMPVRRPTPATIIGDLDDLQRALWQRLLAFNFDQAGPYPFSLRLANENRWPHEYALQIIEEYRKFLFLATICRAALLPADDVRQAWRLHLIYSVSYWQELCQKVLGQPLSHRCDNGTEHASKARARFEKTVNLYRVYFGEPPVAIWYETERLGGTFFERFKQSRKLGSQLQKLNRALPGFQPNIPPEHSTLWRALQKFEFDGIFASYPFALRLAEENKWNLDFALLVIEEYRKFIYLLRTTGHWVTPSVPVDECWHLHLQNTDSYWQKLCNLGNGRPIHHHPGNGSKSSASRFKAIKQRTLFDYREVFGEPPAIIWGKVDPTVDWAKILEGSGL